MKESKQPPQLVQPVRAEPVALHTAEFHPLVRIYLLLIVIFYMIVSVLGIVLIPFWIIGPGQWWSKRYYQRLRCVLRERELYFRRGILVRAESTIPLDRVTDLTVKEGPLLRALGLSMMHVETPGTSGAGGVGGVSRNHQHPGLPRSRPGPA
jgi:putative membrane protein